MKCKLLNIYKSIANISEEKIDLSIKIGSFFSFLSSVILMALYVILLKSSSSFNISNIVYYVIICGVFLIFFVFSLFKPIFIKEKKSDDKKNTKKEIIFLTLKCVLLCIYLFVADGFSINTWGVVNLEDNLAWHKDFMLVPTFFLLVLSIFFSVSYIFNVKHKSTLHVKREKLFYILFTILLIVIGVICLWQPHTNERFSIYHRDAYLYELYARSKLVPYSSIGSGIYGHYGLFFLPFLLLFGNSLNTMSIMVCFEYILAFAIFSYCVWEKSNDKLIRFSTLLALLFPFINCSYMYLYYQGIPHRFLLAAVYCFVMVLCERENISWKAKSIIKFFSVVFATLWSVDMGLIFLISMIIYDFLYSIMKKNNFKIVVKDVCFSILKNICALLVSIFIVNIYNLCVGGNFIFKDFFYPLLCNSFMSYLEESILFLNVSSFGLPTAYLLIIFTLLALMLYGIIFSIKKSDIKMTIMSSLCVFALGYITYYINRPAYSNITFSLPIIYLALIYFINFMDGKLDKKHLYKKCYGTIFIVVVALASLVSIPFSLISANNYENGKDNNFFDVIVSEIKDKVPKNTFGTGAYVQEIYNELGWDNYLNQDFIHVSYSGDLKSNVIDNIKDKDSFVLLYETQNEYWIYSSGLKQIIDDNFVSKYEYSYSASYYVIYYVRK